MKILSASTAKFSVIIQQIEISMRSTSEMYMSVVVNQHFVPQSYLSGFAIDYLNTDKLVWVYNKKFGRGLAPKKPRSIKNICSEDNYYAQAENGDDVIEKKFHSIEQPGIEIIQKLIVRTGKSVDLSISEKEALALYVGFLFSRGPGFRDGIEKIHKWAAEFAMNIQLDEMKEEAPPKLKEYFDAGGTLKVEVAKWISLEPMINTAIIMAESLLNKRWQFYIPPNGLHFITSDNPVFYSGINPSIGPISPFSEIVVPLNKGIALVCTPEGPDMRGYQLAKAEMYKFNIGTVRASREIVVANYNSNKLASLVELNKTTVGGLIVD